MPTCPFCSKTVPDNSSVCPHCLRAQPVTIPTVGRTSSTPAVPWRPIALGALLLGLGAYAWRERDSIRDALPSRASSAPEPAESPVVAAAPTVAPGAPAPVGLQENQVASTIAPPVEIRIADSSAAVIAPNSYLAFPFSGEDRSTCKLRGTVRAVSGGPVDVFVVDGMGADDLANGRTPKKYYESGGVTNVALGASLDGRSHYSLIVANLGAKARAKTVKLNASATCAD